MGGNQSHADKLTRKYPDLLTHHTVLMPEAAMNKAFAAGILDSPASYPSTGFVGIQAALHCTPATVKLHIYGFNWSSKTWSGHNVSTLLVNSSLVEQDLELSSPFDFWSLALKCHLPVSTTLTPS